MNDFCVRISYDIQFCLILQVPTEINLNKMRDKITKRKLDQENILSR